MFDAVPVKIALPLLILKKLCLLLLGVYLIIGVVAAYRAYYQVHSLELQSTDSILQPGSSITTKVVSYARTPVDVRLELIQDTHSETLATQLVPSNDWAFWDPRIRRASQTATLTQDVLSRFSAGKAQLRATAIGREQWTRLPPPVVREVSVEIQQN